jgi:hypothetical protein
MGAVLNERLLPFGNNPTVVVNDKLAFRQNYRQFRLGP